MRRAQKALPFAVVLLAVGSCRCGRSSPPVVSPEERVLALIPSDAVAAICLPRLGESLGGLGGLLEALQRIPGGEILAQQAADVVRQLGADPRTPAGLRQLGLDADGAAAAWRSKGSPLSDWVVALPTREPEIALKRLAELGGQAGVRRAATAGGQLELRAADGTPALAAAVSGQFVLFGRGPLATLLQKGPQPLSASVPFRRLRGRLASVDGFAWLSAEASPATAVLGDSLVGWHWSAQGLRLLGLAAPSWVSLVGRTPANIGWPGLPLDAPLVLRVAGDLSSAGPPWRQRWPAEWQAVFDSAGIDADRELFGNLMPGLEGALSLAEAPDLSQAPSLDPREANPFRWVRLRAFGAVRDPVLAAATLEKLSSHRSAGGLTYARQAIGGVPVVTARYALGESLSFALVGRTVVVTGGAGEMARALAEPHENVAAVGRVALASASVDFAKLAAQVEGVPASAFGGLTGLTLRSMLERLIEPLGHFGPATLELALEEGDLLRAELAVPLR